MTKIKTTKSAFTTSVLALVLCFSMLVGTTFAWFTDSVSTTNNIVTAGNLDLEVHYSTDMTNWSEMDANTNVFEKDALWEPGRTEVVYIKIENVGSLAFRYRLNINVASEIESVNVYGEPLKLSEYIGYGVVENAPLFGDRESAINAVGRDSFTYLESPYAPERANLYPAGNADGNPSEIVIALVVYMDEEVGNEANHLKGEPAPKINLGINVLASQLTYESDSFGDQYDADADLVYAKEEIVNINNVNNTINANVINAGTLNITGGEINGAVENNEGTVNVNNVIIEHTRPTLENDGGAATYEDVTANVLPGDGTWYIANTLSQNANSVYTNLVGTSRGGGIQVYDNASAIFESGSITTNSDATSARHVFLVNGNSTLVIEDGDFVFNPTNLTRKGFYVSAVDNSEVVIYGGNFAKPSTRSSSTPSTNYKTGFYADDTSSITVYGGTFGFNPTNWVAPGYKAVQTGSTWTVVADSVSMSDMLAAGNLTLNADVTLSNEALNVPAGANAVLDLNGHTLTVVNTEAKASAALNNQGTLTIKNGTIVYNGVGDTSFGYGTNTINNSGKLVIDGATIINTTTTGSSVAIDCTAGAELVVESGVIESVKNAIRLCPFGTAPINCTINGGSITGARAIQIHLPSNNAAQAPDVNLTVNGGTLSALDTENGLAVYSYSYGQSFANVDVVINGGTFNGHVAFGGGSYATQENVTVNGGTFNGELGRYLANDGWEDIAKA